MVTQCGEDKEVKTMILEGLLGEMLPVIVHRHTTIFIKKAWLKTVNSLLSGSGGEVRKMLAQEFSGDIEHLVDLLYTCGDYDMESSVVESLLRLSNKGDRTKLAAMWFPKYALVQSLFISIKEFETDCRNFLNCFNQGLGVNQLVFTFPALACQVGDQEMFKPPDTKYRNFWIDFNIGSTSLSVYHVKEEGSKDLWDLFVITKDMVSSSSFTNQAGSTVLTLGLPASQAVITFTPDPKLPQLVSEIFPSKAISPDPVHCTSQTEKCSRAAEEAEIGRKMNPVTDDAFHLSDNQVRLGTLRYRKNCKHTNTRKVSIHVLTVFLRLVERCLCRKVLL